MNKEDDYRNNAAESVELAAKLPTAREKGRLLRLAEKWLDLAEHTSRLSRRHTARLPEHPLVQKKLGPDRVDAG